MEATEKIAKIKKERKDIIESSSKKNIEDTYIDKEVSKIQDIYHVIVTNIVDEAPDVKTFYFKLLIKTHLTPNLAPFKAMDNYITIHVSY